MEDYDDSGDVVSSGKRVANDVQMPCIGYIVYCEARQ